MKIYRWVSLITLFMVLTGCGIKKETTNSTSETGITSHSQAISSVGSQEENRDYIFLELLVDDNLIAIKDAQGEIVFSTGSQEIGMDSLFLASVDVSARDTFFIINNFDVPKVLLNKRAEPIIEGTIDNLVELSDGYYKFQQSELWGLIDHTGKVIAQPDYLEINNFFDDRSLFVKNDASGEAKYGFMDRTGNELIPATYFSASDFNEGWASVVPSQGERATFIDPNGAVLLKPPYENVRPYASGMIPVMNEPGKIGYINEQGELVIDTKFEDGLSFIGDVAPVKFDGKWGLTDKSGNMKVEPKYDGIYTIPGDRLFITGNDDKYGLINDRGEVLFEPKYQAVINSSQKRNPEDYVYTLLLDEKFGFLDPETGEIIIEPKFQDKIVFKNGYATAQENEKLGIINKRGEYVLEPKFSSIGEYNHGVLPVVIDLFEDEMIDSPLQPNQTELTSTYGFITLDEEVILNLDNQNFMQRVEFISEFIAR